MYDILIPRLHVCELTESMAETNEIACNLGTAMMSLISCQKQHIIIISACNHDRVRYLLHNFMLQNRCMLPSLQYWKQQLAEVYIIIVYSLAYLSVQH